MIGSLPVGMPQLEPQKLEKMDPMQNQQCRVCDEPAAGFHFGAFTCEGCKSFFGRTCNNQSVIQECKNNFRCVVDKKNRTACKACRLRKCLMVGMSKSGSRYGRRSNWFKIHCLMQNGGQQSAKRPPPPPPPTSGRPSSERSMPATLSWPPPLRPPTLPQPPKLPPVLHPSYSLMQALPGDLCQPKGSPPPSPPILKPSQEDTSPSNKTLLPSPPLPFPAHFYRHPLTNPLYRLSPLLLASNPLLLFHHKSHLEMIDEHRKLLLSFGISPLTNLPSNKETMDDERDFDNLSEVKVDVDDMEKANVEGDQEEITQGDGEDDEDPVDLTTFKSIDQEALEKEDA